MAVVVVAVRVVKKSVMVSSGEGEKKKGARQPANWVPYWGNPWVRLQYVYHTHLWVSYHIFCILIGGTVGVGTLSVTCVW